MAENLIRVLGREFRFSQVYPSNEKYFKGRSNFGGKGDDSPARKLESRILLIIIHRCKGRRASVHRFDIVRANFSTSRIINRTELGWFEENTGKRKWPRISRQLDNVDNRPSCNIHKPWTTRDEKIRLQLTFSINPSISFFLPT